jgi:TolA-binding protein
MTTWARPRTQVFLGRVLRVLGVASVVATGAALAVGCLTPREKKDMQNDIFNTQTRLLTLERQLADTSKETKNSGESTAKRVAGTQAELDRLNRDISSLKGDVDALKVGVESGQMPGSEATEESVAGRLASLSERMEALEQAQEEMLQALRKAGLKTGGGGRAASQSKAIGNVNDLQKAFDEKKYKQVVEEAPKLAAKVGGADDREEAKFLLAESYFKLGKMKEAALKYNDFLESKPNEKYLPVAKMRIGDCFRHLGDNETAKVYYEELVKDFPDTEEAAKAKERLAEPGSAADAGGGEEQKG